MGKRGEIKMNRLETERRFAKFEHELAFEQSIINENQEKIARKKLLGDKQAQEKEKNGTTKNNKKRSNNRL